MARARSLKSVVQDIVSHFVSRNNRFGGYWAIGVLCSHAIQNRVAAISIDLLSGIIEPPASELNEITQNSAALLAAQIQSARLSNPKVESARLTISFNWSEKRPSRLNDSTIEYSFCCLVEIRSGQQQLDSATSRDWCIPHKEWLQMRIKSAPSLASQG